MYKKTVVKKAKSTTHVCSGCIKDIDLKSLFVAQVPDRDYNTVYCEKCLKELGITVFHTYYKEKVVKPKVIKEKVTKDSKDKLVKEKTTPKTKKTTTPKTKKTTSKKVTNRTNEEEKYD